MLWRSAEYYEIDSSLNLRHTKSVTLVLSLLELLTVAMYKFCYLFIDQISVETSDIVNNSWTIQ